jgi:anti-sigma factor RsiW
VRCSCCEALLGAYAEHELRPSASRGVRRHLDACPHCAALLEELRSVDGLLATARPAALPPNFTFATMAEIRNLAPPARRGTPFWIALSFYVVCAWVALPVALAYVRSGRPSLVAAASAALHLRGWQAMAGALHGFSGFAPGLAAAVVLVLAADMLLFALLWLFYRTMRPHLIVHLTGTRS